MNNAEVSELNPLNKEIYKCISEAIDTDRVVVTNKQEIHIIDSHNKDSEIVLDKLNATIADPDYIIRDDKHHNTGLVIKEVVSDNPDSKEKEIKHTNIVLRVCTDSKNGTLANSVITGWIISDKRLQNYLRNKCILYRKV